jgi:zinc protease
VRVVLDNGLTVLLQENHAARVAALQLWVRVGSADETEDEAGLAHLHEHMLFKGTARRGPGEIARTVEACGGDINAWTSFDQTVYHLVLASDFFAEGLDILADAVTGSVFDPTELSREIEVVCEEIRRGEDMPSRRVSRALFSTAYGTHPYRRPVIGTEASVRSFSREKILDFYQRHYTTQNMVFSAVGDFDTAQALEAVKRAFAGARSAPPVRHLTRVEEPRQVGTRASIATADIREAHLNFGWHIPSVRSSEVAALDLLTVLLGQGDASRLTLEVKRERGLVSEIYASAYTPQDPGLLIIGSTLRTEQIPAALAEALRQTYRLRREEFSSGELSRAKRIVESEAIYQRETVQGQARRFGFFETVAGNVDEEARYLDAVATATGQQIRDVAERHLRSENLTISLLVPQGDPQVAEAELLRVAQEAEAAMTPAVTTRLTAAYWRLITPAITAQPRDHGNISIDVLPSGVRLIVKEDRTVPIVSFRAAWLGGLRTESPENNGIHGLLARSLLRGTTTRSARDLAHEIDELAAGVSGAAGRNSFGARGEFLSADVDHGFELFSDVMLHPSFDPAEFEKERALVLEDIKTRDDSPGSAVFSLFASMMYDQHPYRMEMQGSDQSVRSLSTDDLSAFSRDRFRLDGLTLAVVGDITPERARALAEKHLQGGATGRAASPDVVQDAPLSGPREAQKRLDRKQAHLVLGFRGTTINSPDRFALAVLSGILSGQGGRLFMELRDKRSMAYSVSSMVSEGIDPGYFAVYIGTSPEKIADAKAGIRHELERIRSEVATGAEMDRSRRHLIGSHEIGLQRIAARSAVLALDEAYGLGAENHLRFAETVRSISADDVLRVAQKYIDFERSVTALVSPTA